MGIILPDLIIETTLRDGLEFLRQNPDTIDDIFSELLRTYASRKYGAAEITRIKNLISIKNIAVVHSFHAAAAKSPCYSIQLGSESEAQARAHLGDFEEDVREDLIGSDLDQYEKATGVIPDAYDSISGKVSVPDSVDLSGVFRNFIYVDGSGTEFEIQSGISDEDGDKFFFIGPNLSPDIINPGLIKSFIDYEQFERKGDSSQVNILIGVHSKEPLLTKYLYVILKYILKSRKNDLIRRCFVNSTFQGSDFTKDLHYEGDQVYTRFLTASGQVDDTWRSDNVDLIDSIAIDATPVDCPDDE